MRQSQLLGRSRLRQLRHDTRAAASEIDHERHRFEELKGGAPVVVSAHQLFPTPPDLARQLVSLAEISPNHRVLEPSAGTGNLLRAIGNQADKVAVEISAELVAVLMRCGVSGLHIHLADFLSCRPDDDASDSDSLGMFDRVVMNPPFARGSDIKHIRHALGMLKPGGRLVSLCAAGPRQREALRDASQWIDLPAGSFKCEGTNVATAIVVFDKEGGGA